MYTYVLNDPFIILENFKSHKQVMGTIVEDFQGFNY